jgi:hypothetical protein
MSRSRRASPLRSQHGRWEWWLAPAVLGLAWLFWTAGDAPQAGPAPQAPSLAAAAGASVMARAAAPATAAAASAAPFSVAGAQAREAQREIWQQRLERAQSTLQAYRASTRYPHESQPISAHPDQVHPNQPIGEDLALKGPDGRAVPGLRLRTMQERVFVQGQESVRFSVSVVDEQGKPIPLRILRASAREVPAPGAAATHAELQMNFNDDGAAGDLQAGDGIYGAQLQPATQGFAGLLGQIRTEVHLQYRKEQGVTYFDIVYTPDAPATWQGGVREALEDGSLNFYLKAEVREAGRYVVTGRIDDANGKPFALLTFNDEVEAGAREIRLSLFGKLVRDGKPAFPLTLRDVDAFLLRADAFPDRKLMPRRVGAVHASQTYPLLSFADKEWSSEERDRYLAELNRDVAESQKQVDQLKTGP